MPVFTTPTHLYRQQVNNISLSHFFCRIPSFILLLSCALILTLMSSTYAGEPPKIAKIKAAYVYQFASYTSWPEKKLSRDTNNNDKEAFSICYSGQGKNFINALKQLEDKKYQQHNIHIKKFNPDKLNNCHVLVITHTDNHYIEHLKAISTQPV